MFRSYRLGAPFGVQIRVHGTLLAVLAFFLTITLVTEGLLAFGNLALLLAFVVASVTLHELGHIGAAAIFGIGTTGLTLYPIGGIAQLTREARTGLEEIVVAIAGPAVNIVLAAFAALAMVLTKSSFASIPGMIVIVNLAMCLFNLIPAYPMDGGRVLRGLLWSFTGKRKATMYAARGGQVFAGLFALVGLFVGHITLLLIGVFIYFQASAEYERARLSAPSGQYVQRIPGGFEGPAATGYYQAPQQSPQGSPGAGPKMVIIRTPFGVIRRWEF